MVLAMLVVLVLVVILCVHREKRASRRREKLRATMGRLWLEHAAWTAHFINAVLDGRGDADSVGQRLHANQDQIAAAIGKYYGAPAQRELARLLHEHIAIAGRIVLASKEGRPTKSLARSWETNAKEIADFLCKTNTRWACPEMASMMTAHLSATSDYLAGRLAGRWAEIPKLHDAVVDQIAHIADIMAQGIASDKLRTNLFSL